MKRLFDIIGASAGLLILSPLLVWLAWRIRWEMGTPIIFVQERPGQGGKIFRMMKFRSMRDEKNSTGQLLNDADRITPLGKKIRSSSADELLGLWNVVKGDMSLVGPRPLLLEYLPVYTPDQARRHEVRPGVTGWAQVNGRNAISWEEKFVLDIWYVDNQSLYLDLKIIWLTIIKVIKRDGISAAGEATMPKFSNDPEK